MIEDSGRAPLAHLCTIEHCYKAIKSEQMLLILFAFEHIL